MPTFDLRTAIQRGKENSKPSEQQTQLAAKSDLPATRIATNPTPSKTLNGKYHDAVANYVTGKTDTPPKPNEFGLPNTPQINSKPGFNLKTAVDKSRAQTIEKETQTSNRGILFGTGLTQKLAAKQVTASKQQSASIADEKLDDNKLAIASEQSTADEHSKSLQIAAKSIILDEYQQAALDTLKHERFGCLIGAAGTGKTTLEKQLVEIIKQNLPPIKDGETERLSMAFMAFTGRAVQQMKRALPVEYHPLCSTVHAFLGYRPVEEEYEDNESGEWKTRKVFRPTYTKSNPLPHRAIFIDEGGMLSVYLWNQLIEACPHARVTIIGDINQLPPVQGKSVLGFAMCSWPTYELLKIHRQAEDNPIIKNAHRILQGKWPEKDEKKFAMLNMPDGSLKTQTAFLQVIKKLHQKGIFDPFRDAIIVPKNKDNLGQLILNEQLVAYFNPNAKRELIACGFGNKSFAVGDKVMLLQNDNERGLTNGMTGIVVNISLNDKFDSKRTNHYADINPDDSEIDLTDFDKHMSFDADRRDESEADKKDDPNQRAASHIMTVRFPLPDGLFEEVQFSTVGQFNQITHAYVFTCHKSQGGEYQNVIILCHMSDGRMLTREWLYTAVTRAQERVIICCNERGLLQALHTQKISGKTVQEKAKKFLELQGNEKIEPILPKAQKI